MEMALILMEIYRSVALEWYKGQLFDLRCHRVACVFASALLLFLSLRFQSVCLLISAASHWYGTGDWGEEKGFTLSRMCFCLHTAVPLFIISSWDLEGKSPSPLYLLSTKTADGISDTILPLHTVFQASAVSPTGSAT